MCDSTKWQRKNFYYAINDIEKTITESIRQYKSALDNLIDTKQINNENTESSGNETFVKLVNLPSLKNDDGEELAIAEVTKMWQSAERYSFHTTLLI